MEVPMSENEGPKAKPVPLRPASVPQAFKPESKEVPMAKMPPPPPPQGTVRALPERLKSDLEEWRRTQKDRQDSFLPDGRVEVPLVPAEVKLGLDGKRDMTFVDTLAMQTRLGVQHRAVEQSMSLRDSQIVKARNIVNSSPFAGDQGTAVLAPEYPYAVMGTPRMLDPKAVQVKLAVPPPVPGIVGAEEARKAQEKFWSSPERQSPLPPGTKVASEAQPVMMGSGRQIVVIAPSAPSEAIRQKIQEIYEKGTGEPAAEPPRVVTVLPPTPPQAPVVEVSKHEPVVIEKPASQPVVVTPVIDYSDRILELEAEVAALQNLVIKLASENKILKAKK